jgi:hypothetical protein
LLLAQPVGFPTNVDDDAVMQEAIENRGGDHLIAKNLPPVPKALVTGQEARAFFIPAADELKEEIGALPVDRDLADLVDDEPFGDAVDFELFLQPVFGICLGQGREQGGGRGEGGAIALLNGPQAQGHREVGLPDAGRPEEHEVFPVLDPAAACQLPGGVWHPGRVGIYSRTSRRSSARESAP